MDSSQGQKTCLHSMVHQAENKILSNLPKNSNEEADECVKASSYTVYNSGEGYGDFVRGYDVLAPLLCDGGSHNKFTYEMILIFFD